MRVVQGSNNEAANTSRATQSDFTLEGVVPEAQLIVRGIVQSAVATLSRDQTMVVTELELAPSKFYRGSMAAAERQVASVGSFCNP